MTSGQLVWLALASLLCFGRNTLAKERVDWWESASLYQIYPRSFQDSDGDGIGDLNGITERLPYLKEIGITATWLSPIFASPMADFGYDISNFTQIEPTFGTLADFDNLIKRAKNLGVKIILDFVPNHSSDKCDWFQRSVRREPGFEDFYIWDDGKVDANNASNRLPPSNWISVFGGPMWTWHPERKQFYLHQFLDKQPDLNYHDPTVKKVMQDVLKFWLDRGVAGFRIDAVPHLYEKRNEDGTYSDEPVGNAAADPNTWQYHDHVYTRDLYENTELLYEWRAFLDSYRHKHGGDTRVLLAESYSPINVLSRHFGNGTHFGTQLPMNFALMNIGDESTANDVEREARSWMNVMWQSHKTANWVVGNHDNIRIADRLGRVKAKLLNMIVNALPGASITYYGEEIGMINVTCATCTDRMPVRSPMQWDTTRHAGFTPGGSTWVPVSPDYAENNVEVERNVGRSTLNLYKGIHKLKGTKAFKAFKEQGGFLFGAVTDHVFQIVRTAPKVEEYRIIVNLGNQAEVIETLSDKEYEYVLMNAESPHEKGDKVDLRGKLRLQPYEGVVLYWRKRGGLFHKRD